MGTLNLDKLLRAQNKTLLIGLCLVWLVAVITIVTGVNECGPRDYHPKCDEWSVCVPLDVAQNKCVEINDCSGECPWNEVCCGHGPEKCMCPWPLIRNKKGECMKCVCPAGEFCTLPHGECACGNLMVRDHNGHCVECDPDLSSCPDCPQDKMCMCIEDESGTKVCTCECRPEFVENAVGECTWCQACPETCPPGQLCVRTGFGEATCECPPGMHKLADETCVATPYCVPKCTDGKWCVVRGGIATCECPSGHIPHGSGCMYMPHPKILPKHVLQHHDYSGSGSGSGGWYDSRP